MFLNLKRKTSRLIFLILNNFYEVLKIFKISFKYNNKKFYTNLFRYKADKNILIKEDQFFNELNLIYDYFKIDKVNVIFDIGSNIGTWSVSAKKISKKAKLYSFEPLNYNFNILKKNLIEYENIVTMNFALGNENTRKNISFPEWETNYKRIGNSGLFSISGGTNISAEIVDIKKFDDLSFDLDFKNNGKIFIKIDVEGFELEVLKGMSQFVNNYKVIIKLEFNTKSWKKTKINIDDFLFFIKSNNFKIFIQNKQFFSQIYDQTIKNNYDDNIDRELILIN